MTAMLGLALTACLVGSGAVAVPAQALCPVEDECQGGGGGGGGGTPPPPPPTYTLQGVIQKEEESSAGPAGERKVKIRGYSRLANASNDRVDADYINVRCYAYDRIGYTTDYDSENNGALVDVTFWSNPVYGIGASRVVTVNCTHDATKNGVNYSTTSTLSIQVS